MTDKKNNWRRWSYIQVLNVFRRNTVIIFQSLSFSWAYRMPVRAHLSRVFHVNRFVIGKHYLDIVHDIALN